MNELIYKLAQQARLLEDEMDGLAGPYGGNRWEVETFAALIIKECISKIEQYRIPVGNSSSGELACEWTYAALKEIRDDINGLMREGN